MGATRNTLKLSVREPERKKLPALGRRRRRWANIKGPSRIEEIGCGGVPQDRVQRRSLVKTVMNLRVS
jgi:hypothetical protein